MRSPAGKYGTGLTSGASSCSGDCESLPSAAMVGSTALTVEGLQVRPAGGVSLAKPALSAAASGEHVLLLVLVPALTVASDACAVPLGATGFRVNHLLCAPVSWRLR